MLCAPTSRYLLYLTISTLPLLFLALSRSAPFLFSHPTLPTYLPTYLPALPTSPIYYLAYLLPCLPTTLPTTLPILPTYLLPCLPA